MAASFVSASSQYLLNSTPVVLDYPFSVGIWVYPTTLNTERTFFCLSDTGTTNNYFRLRQSSANQYGLVTADGGVASAHNLAGLAANQWVFWLAQFVDSTNRSLSLVRPDLGVTGSNTFAASAPTGIDTMTFGCLNISSGQSQFFDGSIGEFWITNTDVNVADNDPASLVQLAYGGPFSFPYIAKDLIEYRSFRKYPSSDGDEISEVYHGPFGRQTWSNVAGVTTGPHTPLPYWYVKPDQTIRNLTV